MSLANANDVPGTDGRWFYGVTIRNHHGDARVTVIEKDGAKRTRAWTMENRPLQPAIDAEALRRIREVEA